MRAFHGYGAAPTVVDWGVMFQLRIHGRGGQGVVTAAELASLAAFEDGLHAQAFPSFGSERTGAPVVAFCRIAEREIRTREPVTEPDGLIVQDPTLLHQVTLFAGLRPRGYVLINSTRTVDELGLSDWASAHDPARILTVPAWDICRRHIGQMRPNAALLGGFSALTGVVTLDAVRRAIESRFRGGLAEGNVAAAEACFDHVRRELGAYAHA